MTNDSIFRIDKPAPSQAGGTDVDPSLPEPVRDHLGQQLRSVFTTQDETPKFLGDPAVPEEFEPQLRRLETRLKTHEEGTGAVEQALDGLLDDLMVPAKVPPVTTI